MKKIKIFLLSLASSLGALAADIDVTPGKLEGLLSAGTPSGDNTLVLKGALDARDLAALEKLPSGIKTLDLSGVKIEALTMPNRKYFGRTLFNEGEIPAYTFFKSGLQSLILPSGVNTVCEGAFAGSDITEITIPEGVTSIGDYAFYGCANLKKVNLPSSLKEIGKGAFGNCMALESIDLGSTGVKTLPERVFAGSLKLAGVTLPGGLEKVGREAFSHTMVDELNLSRVAEFEAYALSSMPYLTKLAINPDAAIGDGLLMDNISLNSLTGVPELVPDYFAANCNDLDTQGLVAPASEVGRYSFANTAAPEELFLSSGITRIDRGALSGLTNLKKIYAIELEGFIPEVADDSFEGLDQKSIELWVTDEAFDLWNNHPLWGEFLVHSEHYTGVDEIASDMTSDINIALRGGLLIVESPDVINDVRIYTADGRMAYVASPNQERVEIEAAALPSGIVVVAVSDMAKKTKTVSLLLK